MGRVAATPSLPSGPSSSLQILGDRAHESISFTPPCRLVASSARYRTRRLAGRRWDELPRIRSPACPRLRLPTSIAGFSTVLTASGAKTSPGLHSQTTASREPGPRAQQRCAAAPVSVLLLMQPLAACVAESQSHPNSRSRPPNHLVGTFPVTFSLFPCFPVSGEPRGGRLRLRALLRAPLPDAVGDGAERPRGAPADGVSRRAPRPSDVPRDAHRCERPPGNYPAEPAQITHRAGRGAARRPNTRG